MLSAIKSQLTAENERADDGSATEQGLTSESQTGADGVTKTDAMRESAPRETSEELTLGLDVVFGLLQNRRRRDVLRHLTQTAKPIRLSELAERTAARECEKDVSQLHSQERKRVYVSLYQSHLPKLADAEVINYDKPRGTIERGPTFDQLTYHLPEETHGEQDDADHPLLSSLSTMVTTGRDLL